MSFFQVPLDNAGANETAVAATRPAYAVTDLRRNPVYINLYVNWFRLVASGVVPMARCGYLYLNRLNPISALKMQYRVTYFIDENLQLTWALGVPSSCVGSK